MTTQELVTALEEFPDDIEVYITLPGATQIFYIDKITKHRGVDPVIETDEAPEFADIEGMADACWDEHYKKMSESQKNAMIEFSNKAEKAMERWEE